VNVDIIVPFFEAKSGKTEKLLGTFFVLVIQGVIPGTTGEWKTSLNIISSISNNENDVGRLIIAPRKPFS